MAYDVLVVGAGPAGLTAALYAARRGLSTVVLEEQYMAGGRALLAHRIENYPGFPEGISGAELMKLFEEQAKKAGADIRLGEPVAEFKLAGTTKSVRSSSGWVEGYSVIIATGARQRKLGIPGESELIGKGVSYCAVCDAPFFRERRVVVIGNTTEAAEEVEYLKSFAKEIVWVVFPGELVAEKKAVEEALEGGKVSLVEGAEVEQILGENRVSGVKLRVAGREEVVQADGVFVSVGVVPTTELLKSAGVLVDSRGFVKVTPKMETNLSGVYAAGDCTGIGFQVVTAAAQGALAAMSVASYLKEVGRI